MVDREHLFLILIESLFPDRYSEICAVTSDNFVSGEIESEKNDWEEIVIELKHQAVLGVASLVLEKKSSIGLPVEQQNYVVKKRRETVMLYTQMAAVQKEICQRFKDQGITVAVMKGMAAACYYPNPMLRAMGDIDLIVKPDEYKAGIQVLQEAGFVQVSKSNSYHVAARRNDIIVELHNAPGGTYKDIHGNFVRDFILSGLDAVEIGVAGKDCFPILPWKQNGLELLWHIRQHLHNGLGLRQIIDWMMFVDQCLDDCAYTEYEQALRKSGLLNLAKVVTKMCQKYLGLRQEGISWSREADEQLCDDLMDYIMEQGNFGEKRHDDKAAKIMSGYSNVGMMFRELQRRGLEKWPAVKKYYFLKPIAWSYALKESVKSVGKKGIHFSSVIRDYKIARRRKKMFGRLYILGDGKDI